VSIAPLSHVLVLLAMTLRIVAEGTARHSFGNRPVTRATLTDARPTASKWPSTFDSRTLELWSSGRPLSRNSRSLVCVARRHARAYAGIPAEKAFVVSIHLTAAAKSGCDLWVDDRHSRIEHWPAGGLESTTSSQILVCATAVRWTGSTITFRTPSSTHSLMMRRTTRIRTLACTHGSVDPVLHGMTLMIVTSLESPQSFCALFLDHFRLLFCAHVLTPNAPSFGARPSIVAVLHRAEAPCDRTARHHIWMGLFGSRPWLMNVACQSATFIDSFRKSFARHPAITSYNSAWIGRSN